MQKLFPTLPLQPDETPTSFLSRLARYHEATSVRSFCTDLGLDFQPIVDGEPAAIKQFATLSGAPIDALERQSYRATADGWVLRGERLLKSSLQRGVPRICPECVRQDIAGAGRVPAAALAYGRAIWPILHIRACPVHGLGLITPSPQVQAYHLHDFAGLIEPHLNDITSLSNTASRVAPSPLETYLLARLDGHTGNHPWLDALEFSAAAQTCQVIGRIVIGGRKVKLDSLTDHDMRAAGAAGFEIAAQGAEAIREWLTNLQRTYPYSRIATEGPQAVFGRFYIWLASSSPDKCFDPVREIVRQHSIETMPLGPDDLIFGKPVEKRRLHSIHTASLEYGEHRKRMRKILTSRGLVSETQADVPDGRVLLDAGTIAQLHADGVFNGLAFNEVGDYINAPRPHPRLLFEAGLIKPVVSNAENGIRTFSFAHHELDRFLETLLRDAIETRAPQAGACTILAAAKRANCGSVEIVRLILERKLPWVGRLRDVRGYLSVLVDIDQIKSFLHGQDLEGLTAHEVQQRWRTSHRVIQALIENGHLTQKTVISPVNRCPILIIEREQVERFENTFVSLHALAAELATHFNAVKSALTALGSRPALEPATYHATFFRRDEIPPALKIVLASQPPDTK